MGKGKKKGAKQMSNSQQLTQQQGMSERNVVQEEGFDSDDEKNASKASRVKVDLHGSDSEEDNAAAGGGMQDSKNTETKDRKNLQPPGANTNTNLNKKKNKATSSTEEIRTVTVLPPTERGARSNYAAAPIPTQDSDSLNYENLGNIVVRLLPSQYQAEKLPDGRYVMKAAAIGYLAQKLGH